MSEFNLCKFLIDVFNPQQGEHVLVMVDVPHDNIKDSDEWVDRRKMAEEWRQELVKIGADRNFKVFPMLSYLSTETHGANLPEYGLLGGEKVLLADLFADTSLVICLSQFSATAPLAGYAEHLPKFRGASMPRVTKSMEKTGFAADYSQIQERCQELKKYLEGAEGVRIEFSTGHICYFDMRFRNPSVDDGLIDQSVFGKKGDAILNLPGGETFEVPYEGEKDGVESKTCGEIPYEEDGDRVVLKVEKNNIIAVDGDGRVATFFRDFLEKDKGRRNIAELGFGCNEKADPYGPKVESEKSGFHFAIGASDHLGGIFGDEDFDDPKFACHEDFIYAGKNIITIKKAEIIRTDRESVVIMKNGKYNV